MEELKFDHKLDESLLLKRVNVCLTQEQYDFLNEVAGLYGHSASGYLRQAIKNEMKLRRSWAGKFLWRTAEWLKRKLQK